MNMSTSLIVILLLALVLWIIRSMINDKRNGKNSCGHKCSSCPMAGECHSGKGKQSGK